MKRRSEVTEVVSVRQSGSNPPTHCVECQRRCWLASDQASHERIQRSKAGLPAAGMFLNFPRQVQDNRHDNSVQTLLLLPTVFSAHRQHNDTSGSLVLRRPSRLLSHESVQVVHVARVRGGRAVKLLHSQQQKGFRVKRAYWLSIDLLPSPR